FRDVVGACRPPAERRGGGRTARSPERARHERLRLRLANGIRTTLEDGALWARRTGGVRPKPSCKTDQAMVASWRHRKIYREAQDRLLAGPQMARLARSRVGKLVIT